MKKQIVVIGLGRFGSSVTQSLYNQGHDVLAIDDDELRVQMMMGKATHTITGDATNDLVLRELGGSRVRCRYRRDWHGPRGERDGLGDAQGYGRQVHRSARQRPAACEYAGEAGR